MPNLNFEINMPANLREFHRFLCTGEKISGRKAILGSFSVAHLTRYHDGGRYYVEKESGLDFFYGSSRNQFWEWYKRYLDSEISTREKESILNSLNNNKIAITDIISSCERKEYSALDSSLARITWNLPGVTQLINDQVETFLCTSKWVMQKLELHILKRIGYYLNETESNKIQKEIFPFLKDAAFSLKPLVGVYNRDNSQIVIVALPTPGGGTFRKLDAFGYDPSSKLTTKQFVHLYLESSFKYFISRSNNDIVCVP
jgi:hypothetical protein